jgi:hypothetical protein
MKSDESKCSEKNWERREAYHIRLRNRPQTDPIGQMIYEERMRDACRGSEAQDEVA